MWMLSRVARLYDGTSAGKDTVHRDVDVLVADGRIVRVEPHRADRDVGDDHVVVDASSWTVTPGIVDCHGHVTVLGLTDPEMERANTSAGPVFVEKVLHTTLVDGGVTTMRDVGGATHWMKRLVDEGVLLGPRLKVAICMLSTTGGHADFRGPDRCHAQVSKLWPPGPGRPSSIVDGPWECRKRVREIAACGADLIKLCTSPGVASPGDRLEHRDFTAAEIEAICDEASGRGLKVAAHAHSASGIRLAIENGVHDLQHVSWLDEDLTELAARKGCTVTPTSWVMAELPGQPHLSAFVLDKAKQAAEVHQRAVQHALQGDLPILAGTDPVLPGMHGRNYMEIAHLVRDGLPPLRAWWGATGLAAAQIGQDDAGTLEAGKRADLVIWTDDVLGDPERMDAGAMLEVVKDGEGYRGAVRDIPQRTYRETVTRVLSP